jgi:hypothetical protein
MPEKTIFVPAELFLEHAGVRFFHTYKSDDIEGARRTYHFVLADHHGEDHGFDVRELPYWQDDPTRPPFIVSITDPLQIAELEARWRAWREAGGEAPHIAAILRAAAEAGHFAEGLAAIARERAVFGGAD